MEISIKELTALERCMTVTVPAARVDAAVDSELKKLTQTVKLKGFRNGKVPYDIVKRQFGDSVYHEVIDKLISETFREALAKQTFTVAGRPRIEPQPHDHQHHHSQQLVYDATFEIYPDINLIDISGIKIEKLKSEATPIAIDRIIDKLRQRATIWREVNRQAQENDRVSIDFEGTREGVKIEGGTANNFNLILGSKTMIPGFEQGLVGAQAGSKIKLALPFPDDYHHKDLAGKTVDFDVVVHKVEASSLPELNEEFAKQLGVIEGGVEKLREEIQQNISREIEQLIQNDLKNKVWEQWLQLNTFEVPKVLVNYEIERLQQQFKQQLAARAGTKKLPDLNLPRENFEQEAIRRVKLGLLLNEYIKVHQLNPTKEKIEAKINEIAAPYDKPQEVANWIRHNKEQLAEVEALLMEELAISKLLEKAEILEKNIDCEELMKINEKKEAKDAERTE